MSLNIRATFTEKHFSDGKFVPPATLVDTQYKADALGDTPDDLKYFNDEVIKINKEFAASYGLKSKMRRIGIR